MSPKAESDSLFKHVGPNIINMSGFFVFDGDMVKEYVIPFASSQSPILFIASSDDQMVPSVHFVSK